MATIDNRETAARLAMATAVLTMTSDSRAPLNTRVEMANTALAILNDPNCRMMPIGHVDTEPAKSATPEYEARAKAHFVALGYTDELYDFVANDPDTKIRYKARLSREFMNKSGQNDNILSYGYLCRVYDWGSDLWNPLPELPLELISKLVPNGKAA